MLPRTDTPAPRRPPAGPARLAPLLPLAAALLAGCPQPGRVEVPARPPRPVAQIDKIELWMTPGTPVNWDDQPGPDGFQVQVRFYRLPPSAPLPLTVQGTVEFLMFDESVAEPEIRTLKPARTWSFSGPTLQECLARSIVGWGYAMRLPWETPPAARIVTLAAVYHPPQGPAVWSAPIHVAMSNR